ncbi:putative ribonuclease H-like domain-containing protein [Tanacetum coccineum]
MTHPSPKRNMVPKAALMRSSLVSLTTARPVNTTQPRTTVNSARPMTNVFNKAHLTIQVSDGLGPQKRLGSPKETDLLTLCAGQSTTRFGGEMKDMLPLEVTLKEGKSQAEVQSKLNSVLFNDIECIVLSLNFKLTDESHVLLKVPRKNNMYSVDLKNIVPKGGLTCLFAKATSDESKLWHKRLGHINFKTMNKLVKGNLVRGLPAKLFENDQTCIACQKGKQHRASCKSKTVSSISQPLHMLHMDLFGPTFVKSLIKKMYCLVVTDYYSRFSWGFFLATKDETSGILKYFINGVENLIDQRVKVIRCDNGTEFKNKEMNQFYERKADSKLPTTFWAEAVNTACYVQNKKGDMKNFIELTFYKAFFSPQWKFLIHTVLQCLSAKTTAWNEFSSTMASAIICLTTNQKFNFSKYIFESMVKNLDNVGKFLMYPRRPKEKDTQAPQSSVPSDPKNVADEAVNEEPSMQLKELMDFYTKLQQRVLDMENTKLYKAGRSARVVSFEEASLGDQEDASKQGRKIDDIDKDAEITLVDETQGRYGDEDMLGVNDLDGDEVVVKSEITDKAGEKRNIVEEAVVVTDAIIIPVSAAIITNVELTLAQTLA